MRERVLILGTTGSIGNSTLEVIKNYPEKFKVVGVSCYKNIKRLEEIIINFQPEYVWFAEEKKDLIKNFPKVKFFVGKEGLKELIFSDEIDTIVIAISGIAGLYPSYLAAQTKKRILSANKESLVAAGELITKTLKLHNNRIIPLDSEHNAIFNLLERIDRKYIKKIILTASGGPFFRKKITRETSLEDVLAHPTWKMGKYITVNSATMINKGFEVIEAHFLFELGYDKIDVLIHPQSLTHGVLQTIDGSNFMVTSPNDMKFPITLALFYPEIPEGKFASQIFENKKRVLEFHKVNYKKFPLLNFCYQIGEKGGLAPAVLNAANEFFVEQFIRGAIPFYRLKNYIVKAVEDFLSRKTLTSSYTIEDVFDVDREVKLYCEKVLKSL